MRPGDYRSLHCDTSWVLPRWREKWREWIGGKGEGKKRGKHYGVGKRNGLARDEEGGVVGGLKKNGAEGTFQTVPAPASSSLVSPTPSPGSEEVLFTGNEVLYLRLLEVRGIPFLNV